MRKDFWLLVSLVWLGWSAGCLAYSIAARRDPEPIAVHAGFTVFWLGMTADRIARRP